MERVLTMLEQQASDMEYIRTKIKGLERSDTRLDPSSTASVADAEGEMSMVNGPVRQRPILEDHRTAPHKLFLLWPSVGLLLGEAYVHLNDGYAMAAEDRGVLRIYARGEEYDEHDGLPGGRPASPACSEDGTGGTATSPPDGPWGTAFPQTIKSEIQEPEPFGVGGLKSDGSLDLEIGTINVLYESYIRHMHAMHPFLDPQRLRTLFDAFIEQYRTSEPNLRRRCATGNGLDPERPLKRQRSDESKSSDEFGRWHRSPTTDGKISGECDRLACAWARQTLSTQGTLALTGLGWQALCEHRFATVDRQSGPVG